MIQQILVPTKTPPRGTKKPLLLYQETLRQIPKKNPKCTNPPPKFTENPPIDVAGIDPHESYMHHQKHRFYLVVEPCGSHASTWLQTHTRIAAHTLLLHPIAKVFKLVP